MQSPEQFVEEFMLQHSDPNYNPQKAHEYYLKRRELKGRHPGLQKSSLGRSGFSKSVIRHPKPKQQSASEKRAAIKAKVAALQSRLDTLRKVLALLVQQAQARNGSSPKKTTPSKDKPQTSKQKATAEKSSKDYYKKHKNDKQSPSQELKAIQAKIATVSKRIAKLLDDRAKAKKNSGFGKASN